MIKPQPDNEILRAFLLGYAFACGKRHSMAQDENKNHDPENGRFAEGESGGAASKSKELFTEAEAQKKIDSINIDLSKDNVLPELESKTLEELDKPSKPVLLKKNIIDKNLGHHEDLMTPEQFKSVIGGSLYKPEMVLRASETNPNYFNFVKRIRNDKSTIVLLEMSDKKSNYEVVNLHFIKERQLNQKIRRDKKIHDAGGQPTR